MIAYREPDASSAPPAPILETDPVEILATAMIELQAQGRIVDIDALDAYCRDLTRPEIERHATDAAARAKLRLREAA